MEKWCDRFSVMFLKLLAIMSYTHATQAGQIVIHNAEIVATALLPTFFQHSNYTSLQRQLNNYGFKKIAGKGKMNPCVRQSC